MKKVLMSIAAVAMVAVMASCGGNANTNNTENNECDSANCEAVCDSASCSEACDSAAVEAADSTVADLSKKFVCPSRCESADEAGNCSKCGMELVENN